MGRTIDRGDPVAVVRKSKRALKGVPYGNSVLRRKVIKVHS